MTRLDRLTDRLETATRLDALARPAAAFWQKVLSPAPVATLASGTPVGHPVHPMLVQVSAGALLSSTVLDAAGVRAGGDATRAAARTLVATGLAAAIPTVLAGWSDWLSTEQAEKRVGLVHAATNVAGLSSYVVSYVQRRGGRSGLASGLAGAALLGAGGWLGGHLAYAQGVGVDTTAFQAGPGTWTDVAAASDITGSLTAVQVDGVALLVTRVDGDPVVLADRCTHRGAPLSEGTRVGDCVVCPWHGSRFALETGEVRRGPATRPQPRYEVREDAGRVCVRRVEPRALRTRPV